MKTSIILLIFGGIILLVGGMALLSSTDSSKEAEPTATTEAAPVSDGALFVQEAPLTSPGSDGATISTPVVSQEAQTTQGVVITMEDTGFVPATVTVAAGTKVTFLNNGQGLHWPASDLHPTHNVLPGFDAKRGLATGESYEFTFTKPGTWAFHDHLRPNLRGEIVVK